MKRIIEKIGRKALSVLVAAAMSGLCSCEKIFEYEGDCDPHWQIQFVFERNLQFTDAFAANVGSVRLDVFDAATGKLVLEQRESGDALATGHYVMPVTLDPGRYYFVAWCGMATGTSPCPMLPTVPSAKTSTAGSPPCSPTARDAPNATNASMPYFTAATSVPTARACR